LFPTGAMLFWGINFHVAKLALNEAPPMITCFFRFVIALLPIIFIVSYIKESFLVLKDHFLDLLIISLIGVFLFNYFFFLGLKTTSPVNASILVATNPLSTSILATLFFKDKTLSTKKIVLIFSSLIGVLFILSKGKMHMMGISKFSMGDAYVLIATLCFSLSTILIKKRLDGIPPLAITINTTLLAIFPFFFLSMSGFNRKFIESLSSEYWYACFEIGILGTSLAYFLWNKSILELGYGLSSLFLNLVPFFAILISVVFSRTVEMSTIIGGGIIVLSILMFDRAD
jgi:drug/metabolite transporter (DMT)-like permease